MKVHPATPREWLIGYLYGDYEPPQLTEEEHPIDRWRIALIQFICDYWATLQPQLTCPARYLKSVDQKTGKTDPRPCFGCADAQVIHCVADNQKNIERIALYLPRRKQ